MESEKFAPGNGGKKKAALLKAVLFVLFLVAAIAAARVPAVKGCLTAAGLERLLNGAGLWAPLVYILVYVVGVCLFVPATLLTSIGAAVFGSYWGFLFVWIGSMAGASLSFLIGRSFGRDFAASLIGERLKPYDEAIERNGFATVLYLRMILVPFAPMNFGMGLTRVRFRDYFSGTAIGIMVWAFIVSFFVGTFKEAWANGAWSDLLAWKTFFALLLFVSSLFAPKMIMKLRAARARSFLH